VHAAGDGGIEGRASPAALRRVEQSCNAAIPGADEGIAHVANGNLPERDTVRAPRQPSLMTKVVRS
jgi:hypothetical protein